MWQSDQTPITLRTLIRFNVIEWMFSKFSADGNGVNVPDAGSVSLFVSDDKILMLKDEAGAVTALVSKGDAGAQGVQGPQGETGSEGAQGLQGIQGIQGETGLQGVQGSDGAQGLQGVAGIQGVQGNEGVQGIKGDTGLQGVQGIKGDTGGNYIRVGAAVNIGASATVFVDTGLSIPVLAAGSYRFKAVLLIRNDTAKQVLYKFNYPNLISGFAFDMMMIEETYFAAAASTKKLVKIAGAVLGGTGAVVVANAPAATQITLEGVINNPTMNANISLQMRVGTVTANTLLEKGSYLAYEKIG